MKDERPVNLDLFSMKFPIMAIASIFHRLSGVVIFFFLPFLLYHLHASLSSSDRFEHTVNYFSKVPGNFIIWLGLTAVIYHLIAGFRHLIMDMGYGESLCVGRLSAIIVIALSAALSLGLGVWLW